MHCATSLSLYHSVHIQHILFFFSLSLALPHIKSDHLYSFNSSQVMDLWCVHAKSNVFLLKNSFSEKRICGSSKNNSMNSELRSSKAEFVPRNSRYRSFSVIAMAKRSSGNSDSNSFSANSGGNSDDLKAGGDDSKGNDPPSRSKKSDDTSSQNKKSDDTSPQNPRCKPLDWREFRALLYMQEQAEKTNFCDQDETSSRVKSLPSKWAHPISAAENGCLLIATEKLDGVRTFERTVILLLRSGSRNPQEGPFGVVINRPLHKNMKHMNPTNIELGSTFSYSCFNFGGPLDASMFLLRAGETTGLAGFEEVIPGLYFGSRNSLYEASALIKKGKLRPQDIRFFMGYAGWQLEQLQEEIESDYWHVAACSANLISWDSLNSSSDNLWEEILQLMGGPYSELSRMPKQDS